MTQTSGPRSTGTATGRQLTDIMWRDMFGDEPGVLDDRDGTSYKVVLPSSGDILTVGSSTQDSKAQLAGFVHKVPAGQPESLTIPAASGSARTDIIGLRYDKDNYTGDLGPVRLVVITGTSSNVPTYDATPTGIEEMPLYAITRQPGQTLSQATVVRLYPRISRSLSIPTTSALPLNSPLDTVVQRGPDEFRRQLDASSNPVWLPNNQVTTTLLSPVNGDWIAEPDGAGAYGAPKAREMPWGEVRLSGVFRRAAITATASAGPEAVYPITAPLPASLRPTGGQNRHIGLAATPSGPVEIYYLADSGVIGYQFNVTTPVYRTERWYVSFGSLSYPK